MIAPPPPLGDGVAEQGAADAADQRPGVLAALAGGVGVGRPHDQGEEKAAARAVRARILRMSCSIPLVWPPERARPVSGCRQTRL